MIQLNKNEQIIKISNWISRRLSKLEAVLGLIFFVTLLVKISTDLPVNIIITENKSRALVISATGTGKTFLSEKEGKRLNFHHMLKKANPDQAAL